MKSKKVLVTGCCGTVGQELVKQLLSMDFDGPSEIVGVDSNESELFFIDQKYVENPKISFFMCDMRDLDSLNQVTQNVDIVFHAAALKHVVLCERSPGEAVQTNIQGVHNIILASKNNGVQKVIFTSSDKAVNPTSVMGTSKLMGERLMTAANSNAADGKTIFASTRFGNVLGSNGSVIPIFKKQIATGGPVTITDDQMTRFVMTIEQAAKLVLDSAKLAKGGEVLITKMPVIRIIDLAHVMIDLIAPCVGKSPDDIKIKIIGSKPGEKLYEELMSDEETRRAIELQNYFSVLPAYRGIYRDIDYYYPSEISRSVANAYNSAHEEVYSKEKLKEYVIENNLIKPEDLISEGVAPERYWPGDKEERSSSNVTANAQAVETKEIADV